MFADRGATMVLVGWPGFIFLFFGRRWKEQLVKGWIL
jgi:hypothetical protein